MGRKPIPISSRDAIARDQRLVIMLTKRERERFEAAMVRYEFGTFSDLARAAIDQYLDKLEAEKG